MEVTKIAFAKLPQFSKKDRAYAARDERLRPFYKYSPQLESFAQAIEDKAKDPINRSLLVEVLKDQYASLEMGAALSHNIELLLDNRTFTLTTAHQPSLFTGPLYYIYKIISAINLAERLQKEYPDYNFVPVFVTGGEDHDFEEANHANIFGKRLEWQSGQQGSVGAMSTDTLTPVLEELENLLGDREADQFVKKAVLNSYRENDIYSVATVAMVHQLFGDRGLVVLNMNEPRLKRAFIPHLRKELFEQPSEKLVLETSNCLDEAGFKPQATPRPINLFYLRDQLRERIVEEAGIYTVLNTEYRFTKAELEAELEAHPEHFSPNVVMRPIYQESILPNLAYIGGGGELAYWMERQSQFAHFGLNFPILMRRNSALWLDRGMAKKRQKLGLSIEELFADVEDLIKLYVQRNATESLDFSAQRQQLADLFAAYQQSAKRIDPSLEKAVLAEKAKQEKGLGQLEGRLHRAEKQKHDTAISQLRNLKDKLFPGNNGLQERSDNFIGLYLKYGPSFLDTLYAALDPLDPHFVIIEDPV